MPIYEYRCESCGGELEVWQKITEKPKRVCPECGKHQLQRLISNTSFRLKGTGWYVTDYAKGKNPSSSAAKSEDKSETSESKSTSSSSDSGSDD
jgi:putative FmdB family regulatory protein